MGLNNSKTKERGNVSIDQGISKSTGSGQADKGWTNKQADRPSDHPKQTSGPIAEAAAAVQELNSTSTQRFFQPQTKTNRDLRTDATRREEEERGN